MAGPAAGGGGSTGRHRHAETCGTVICIYGLVCILSATHITYTHTLTLCTDSAMKADHNQRH